MRETKAKDLDDYYFSDLIEARRYSDAILWARRRAKRFGPGGCDLHSWFATIEYNVAEKRIDSMCVDVEIAYHAGVIAYLEGKDEKRLLSSHQGKLRHLTQAYNKRVALDREELFAKLPGKISRCLDLGNKSHALSIVSLFCLQFSLSDDDLTSLRDDFGKDELFFQDLLTTAREANDLYLAQLESLESTTSKKRKSVNG